jgi:uncharacterized membrane protein
MWWRRRRMMLKKNNIENEMVRLDIITGIFCLLPMLIGLILYSELPAKMAVHFNVKDQPGMYAAKAFVVFGIPMLMLLVHAIICLASERDVKKSNVNRKLAIILRFVIPTISVVIETFIFMYALGYAVTPSTLALILVGVMIFVVGNYLPKCKQNHYVGFKLPWTMKDESNWNKTHRLAGWLWIISGFLMIVMGMLHLPEILLSIPLILVLVIPFVYSFLLSLKK